jgi:hypothetical protein
MDETEYRDKLLKEAIMRMEQAQEDAAMRKDLSPEEFAEQGKALEAAQREVMKYVSERAPVLMYGAPPWTADEKDQNAVDPFEWAMKPKPIEEEE